jgi:hypothetical protein
MTYKVFIDDNFHYMDESERYTLGEFPTLAAAIEAAKKTVDDYLLSTYKTGMTSQELNASYASFGEDPFIVNTMTNEGGVLFSARDYAMLRCNELCSRAKKQN